MKQQICSSDFFQQCGHQLKDIALDSRLQQQKIRKLKKIEALRAVKQIRYLPTEQKLMDNILVDYLRSFKLNYTYSVIMRQRNLTSDEIMSKQKIMNVLHLNELYNSTDRFDISVLEMLLIKLADFMGEKKEKCDSSVQVELLNKDKTVNNQLINELRISQTRKQVQQNEKKHYNEMLATLKKQLTITIKDDLRLDYDNKMKTMKQEYEKQVQLLKEKNKQFLVNNPKLNPKIQEYLTSIEQLQASNMDLKLKVKQFEKQRITHNCLKNQNLLQKQNDLKKEKTELDKKKKQYQLAIKSIQTSVEQLVAKKAKINEQPRETDKFVAQIRRNKQSKDHMIEEIYGRLFVMDKRIQTVTKDNQNLMEENRQLLCKVKQLEEHKQRLMERGKDSLKIEEQMKKFNTKPKRKDVQVGVTQEQIRESLAPRKQENAIDEDQSFLDTEEEQQSAQKKQKYRLEVNNITSGMKLLKNKLRFMVQDFS